MIGATCYKLACMATLTTAIPSSVQAGQTVAVVLRVPADTPADAAVFVAGSLPSVGNWKADGVRMTRARDGTYTGNFIVEAGQSLEYKFTRGSWDTVEKSVTGGDLSNRVFIADTPAASINAAVARWGNATPNTSTANTVIGTLRIVQVPATGQHAGRTIRVWLPPAYDAAASYPVLYMQDGQNCFDRATSAYGSEWQIDETLTRLIADGTVPPLIVVGIDNAGADRIKEYTFAADPLDGGGDGAAYADLLLHGVMPFVEASFRVKRGPANTFVGGSSLGALISLEIAWRNPGVFGGVLAMSPALWWDDQMTTNELDKDSAGLARTRVWIDIGTREAVAFPEGGSLDTQNQRAVDETRRLDAVLTRAGIEHRLTVEEGAQHQEAAWARRFPAAVVYLLSGR